MMGCFTVLRSKKKKSHFDNPLVPSKKSVDARESTSSRLPEPEVHVPSLQSAPPSFRNRVKISESSNEVSNRNSRARVLSAPSALIVVDQFGFPYSEYRDQDDSRDKEGLTKGHRFSNPLPLPLPSREGHSFRNSGSFKASNVSGPLEMSGPLPLPLKKCDGLRIFSYEEISSACQRFSSDQCVSETLGSTSYKATFRDEFIDTRTTEATVARLLPSTQSLKEFKTQATTLASLQHPNLCKLIGYYAKEDSNERMLVYERLYHGSLDKLLFGRSDGRFMDWSKRLKVALGAARGLAFLHDEGPFQAMYSEFSTLNIQIDKGFTAKLSGYGCVGFNTEEISNAPVSAANLSVETLEKGLLTPKSNVWSFGVVLLELITGRKNLDPNYSKEERNIVNWSRPFLTDDSRLSLIMDSRIKGRFPTKAARIVADIILKCLRKDPSERPTMRDVVEALARVQEIKVPCRYPLQEPSAAPRKVMLKSTSLNGIVPHHPVITFSPSPPSHNQHLISPRSSTSALFHPRACSSTLDDPSVSSIKKTPPIMRRSSVEGF
ncbi:serine/threonine-protein kinase NAK [Zea mays]|nr:serine/threonine-protein kinase NAK [Zea mays]ACN26904.1 unknown [Zea mays]ONM36780.1 Protein kinase superfamily protein [Zea mays]ONM36783.1 Protein kinase superfamily protein [Zea mays]ONM36784.1 Protein kinase superfamily protein [Zea mays]ONM36785.1 Protein kinase superfamily protein [Zea mays]